MVKASNFPMRSHTSPATSLAHQASRPERRWAFPPPQKAHGRKPSLGRVESPIRSMVKKPSFCETHQHYSVFLRVKSLCLRKQPSIIPHGYYGDVVSSIIPYVKTIYHMVVSNPWGYPSSPFDFLNDHPLKIWWDFPWFFSNQRFWDISIYFLVRFT